MKKYKLMTLQINSTEEQVKTYIGKSYDRLMDYAIYQSAQAGIPDEANDLLNEVLLAALQRDHELLERLYLKKKGKYTELDFYLLNLIKMNAHSLQSPYRWKNRSRYYKSVSLDKLKIIEENKAEIDKAEILLKQYRNVLWVFKGLELSELERKVFEFKFVCNESFKDWPGPENYRLLNLTYNLVLRAIHHVLYYYDLTNLAPKRKITTRQSELAEAFVRSRKVQKNKTITHT